MSQFQQPGISNPEDKFVPSENNGALLLFFPTQLQTGIKTQHGESDAVAATVVRLNDGRVYDNALIFPTALVTQLKAAVPDGMVLGTLGQGENTKGNPPWLLRPHTEQDVQVAEQWLALNPRNTFAQPAPSSSPTPSAAGWAAPPTPAASPAWGSPAPAASPAPATGGWGAPPVQANAPAAGWGAHAPAASSPAPSGWGSPAPAAEPDPTTYDEFVAAFKRKGVDPAQITSPEQAASVWALIKNNPNVA